MKNKMFKLVVLTTMLNLNSFVNADFKMGVIDSQVIMNNPEVAKPVQAEINDIQTDLQKPLQSLGAEIEKKAKAIEAKAKVSTLASLEKEQDELKDLQNKYEMMAKSAKEKFEKAYNKIMMQFGKLVQEAAEKVRSELGLSIIIDKNATLAYDKAIDVTDKLIEAVKKNQVSTTKGK